MIRNEQVLVDFRSDKARALLAYLALSGNRSLRRKHLIDLLWPDFNEESARLSLRSVLHNLNQLTKPCKLLYTTYQTVQFIGNETNFWCDVLQVEALLIQNQATMAEESLAFLRMRLQQEFLPSFEQIESAPFQEWLSGYREHYQHLRHSLRIPAPFTPPANERLKAVAHNLPCTMTPLLGRTTEIGLLLKQLINADCRLLVLVGEGGIGKTRLALAAAQAIIDHRQKRENHVLATTLQSTFKDGIWFVALNDIVATADVDDELAMSLGRVLMINFAEKGRLIKQVFTWLRPKSLLLILDSFEHLVPHADFLSELLQAAPEVKVLVTSRQRIKMQAAAIIPVRELALPPKDYKHSRNIKALLDYSAIALFMERAQRSLPGFQLKVENQSAITRICTLMAGLPLGIELAATLLEIYSCEELAARLTTNPAGIKVEWADLPLRHRSLQTVLESSWQLLTVEQARIMDQSSVFCSAFSSSALRTVTGATPEQVQNLVHKSLLRQVSDGDGYFVLHDLVRSFAQKRLHQDSMLEQRTYDCHATYYLQLLQQQEAALPNELAALQLVLAEIENIRVAWEWSVKQQAYHLLEMSLDGLTWLYRLVAFNQEGLRVFQQAITQLRKPPPLSDLDQKPYYRLRARLLISAAEFTRYLDQHRLGKQFVEEAIELSQLCHDRALLALAYQEGAWLASRQNDYQCMLQLADQALLCMGQSAPLMVEIQCWSVWGSAQFYSGNVSAVVQTQLKLERLLDQVSNRYYEATVKRKMGFMYYWQCDYPLAVTCLQQAILSASELNQQQMLNFSRQIMGDVWRELGYFTKAEGIHTQALAFFQACDDPFWQVVVGYKLGITQRLQGNTVMAHETLRTALRVAKNKSIELLTGIIQVELGHILAERGAVDEALVSYQYVIQMGEKYGYLLPLSEAYTGLAELYLAQQRSTAAQEVIDAALPLLSSTSSQSRVSFVAYWQCYRVLQALADPRAPALLQRFYDELMQIATRITDSNDRRSFLENVPANRSLVKAMEQAPVCSVRAT